MDKLTRVVFFATAALFVSPSVDANCEGGGYSIHTVATYAKPDPTRILFLYERQPDGLVRAKLGALEQTEEFKRFAGKWKVIYGGENCASVPSKVDPGYQERDSNAVERPFILDTKKCESIRKNAPVRGYFLLNEQNRTIRFPREMKVDRSGPAASEKMEMEKAIDRDLATRKLHLYTYGSESEARGPITPAMIAGKRFEWTTVGAGSKAFDVAIAVLQLKGVKSAYFPSPTDAEEAGNPATRTDRKRYDIPSGKADFPVIYFRSAGKDPKFVGDGSLCSYVNYKKYPAPQSGSEGSFDRFSITRAFDLDHDEGIDLLEVNEQVTYRIRDGGALEVVNVGMGC
jgi:hypothetical protein